MDHLLSCGRESRDCPPLVAAGCRQGVSRAWCQIPPPQFRGSCQCVGSLVSYNSLSGGWRRPRSPSSTDKKSPGGAGTHTGHTGTRAHGSHRRTSQPTQPNPHQRTRTAQPRDDRIRGRLIQQTAAGPQEPRSRPLPAANSEEAGTGAALMTACPGHASPSTPS